MLVAEAMTLVVVMLLLLIKARRKVDGGECELGLIEDVLAVMTHKGGHVANSALYKGGVDVDAVDVARVEEACKREREKRLVAADVEHVSVLEERGG